MIKIDKTRIEGFESAIRGMRNPMNSWGKMDSNFGCVEVGCEYCIYNNYVDELGKCWQLGVFVGPNDLRLMKNLVECGSVDAKFRRMLTVYADITAPLYWWKEFDTYKVGTVANSCSTMHKIHAKEFTLEDFSREHLIDFATDCYFEVNEYGAKMIFDPKDTLVLIINMLNKARDLFLETKDKKYWWQMIQLLPSSYNQKRTVLLNYEVLSNIYKHRKDHKLDEWHTLCKWITTLPISEIITLGVPMKEE